MDFGYEILKALFSHIPENDSALAMYYDQGGSNHYSILFFFDADKEGKQSTLEKFRKDYADFFGDLGDLEVGKWVKKMNVPLGLFIFTDDDGETGTLEDTLVSLFKREKEKLVDDSLAVLNVHSDHSENSVASKSKKAKSALTICGQMEKDRAGAALSVVVRHCGFLENAFSFEEGSNLWCRIVNMIETAFKEE